MNKEGIVYIVGDPGDWEYIGEFAVEVIHFSTASSLLLSLNTFDKPLVFSVHSLLVSTEKIEASEFSYTYWVLFPHTY